MEQPDAPIQPPVTPVGQQQQPNQRGAVAAAMPARNHSSAPRFDSNKPRELPIYFRELELLLDSAQIVADQEKKENARRYLQREDFELWKSLPEFAANVTYEDFKTAVLRLYPGATEDRKYCLADVDRLIEDRKQEGIQTLEELSGYYRRFLVMTSYLLDTGRMAPVEQKRLFIKGFPTPFLRKVDQRLQIKFPDHHPDEAFSIQDVFKAAQFILQGSTFFPVDDLTRAGSLSDPLPRATSSAPVKEEMTSIKTEDFYNMMNQLAKTVADSVTASVAAVRANSGVVPTQAAAPMQAAPRLGPSENLRCNFCGQSTHFIARCPEVEAYCQAGKIRRNAEGKVVLSGGSYIPRSLEGQWLRDKVDNWHRMNPGQTVQGRLSSNMNDEHGINPSLFVRIGPQLQESSTESSDLTGVMMSSTNDVDERIQSLQHEIMNLHAKKRKMVFDGVELPAPRRGPPNGRQQPSAQSASPAPVPKEPQIRILQRDKGKDKEATSTRVADKQAVTTNQPAATGSSPNPTTTTSTAPAPQVHPFQNAKDANYLPPANRNYAALPKAKEKEAGYHTVAPVQNPEIATDVFNRTLGTEAITLTWEELLALSPDLRTRYKELLTPKRQPVGSAQVSFNDSQPEEIISPAALENVVKTAPIFVTEDGCIIPDTMEVYHAQVDGRRPILKAAKEANSLRSIHMLVDNKEEIECVVDPGSMIVAMSDSVSHELGIVYDPSFRIDMQTANGEVEETYGIARNIPFSIKDITLFLQVHVVRSPAYDILLGRPFDVLTESGVKNYKNKDQVITITDPNSKRVLTIPTSRRGKPKYAGIRPIRGEPGFHCRSMN